MTRDEMQTLFKIIHSVYDNFNPTNNTVSCNTWRAIMADVSFDDAEKAFYAFVRTDKDGFPPKPGQLLHALEKADQIEDETSEIEAWSLVCKAAKNGNYGSVQEYNKLPEIVQKVLGAPSTIQRYAGLTDGEMEKEHVTFANSYKLEKARSKDRRLIEPRNDMPNLLTEIRKRQALAEKPALVLTGEKSE